MNVLHINSIDYDSQADCYYLKNNKKKIVGVVTCENSGFALATNSEGVKKHFALIVDNSGTFYGWEESNKILNKLRKGLQIVAKP